MILDITVEVRTQELREAKYDAIMLGVISNELPSNEIFSAIDEWGDVKIEDLIKSGEIKGSFKEFTILHYAKTAFKRLIIMGLGNKEDYTLDRIRSISAKAARTLRRIGITRMAVLLSAFPDFKKEEVAQVISEGVILGLYKYDKNCMNGFKVNPFTDLLFIIDDQDEEKKVLDAAGKGFFIANGSNFTRDLTNTPANILSVERMVEIAVNEAEKANCEIEVLDYEELKKRKMEGIITIGKASDHKPALVHIKYRKGGADCPIISIVGKGVVFDSGGLHIKPGNTMDHMSYDMAGAASALGVLYMLYKLDTPVNVDIILPIAENSISGDAVRPGDVIRTYSGKYVEIVNTDAEGRLIMADAMTYAQEQGADVLMDIATLTGAVKKALGFVGTGVCTNNDNLNQYAIKASKYTEEKTWKLPIFKEFEIQLKSLYADVRNLGDGGAGSSVAALFLSYFVKDIPWIHFDIAGTSWIDELYTQYYHKPYLPKKGATGVGARLLYHMIYNITKDCNSDRKKLKKMLGDCSLFN